MKCLEEEIFLTGGSEMSGTMLHWILQPLRARWETYREFHISNHDVPVETHIHTETSLLWSCCVCFFKSLLLDLKSLIRVSIKI